MVKMFHYISAVRRTLIYSCTWCRTLASQTRFLTGPGLWWNIQTSWFDQLEKRGVGLWIVPLMLKTRMLKIVPFYFNTMFIWKSVRLTKFSMVWKWIINEVSFFSQLRVQIQKLHAHVYTYCNKILPVKGGILSQCSGISAHHLFPSQRP